jgi:transposase-like protein
MDGRKDSAQVQRLEVVELGRRRRWSAEAKLRIVEESFAGWRQVSATARRHGISPSLLFAWRKMYRAGALVDAGTRAPSDWGGGWKSRRRSREQQPVAARQARGERRR